MNQVRYIFSDKTGTLTQNVMIFKHCSVAGIMFTEDNKSSLVEVCCVLLSYYITTFLIL